ncbi:MAG: hypothetical protein J1E41_06985 [Ruminococcus sp.]|nr:hypothetical protein [Ruminococcus sp.]
MTNHIEGNDIAEDLEKAVGKVKKIFSDGETENSCYNYLLEVTKVAVKENYLPIEFENHTEAGRCKYILFGIIIHLICEVMLCTSVIRFFPTVLSGSMDFRLIFSSSFDV